MNTGDYDLLIHEIRKAAHIVDTALLPSREWKTQLKEMAEPLAPLRSEISRATEGIAEHLKQLRQSFAPMADLISAAFVGLPERDQKALRILAENGWYLDPDFTSSQLFQLAEEFQGDNANQTHDLLCDHFNERLDDIEDQLCQRFPHRKRIIGAAFRAHRIGEYALSIPVLLVQADGICDELVGLQLYSSNVGIPSPAKRLKLDAETTILVSTAYPLTEQTPLIAQKKERAGASDMLYRHAILHGESTDYDSPKNSCRAVSLLNFVAWVLDDMGQDAN